MTLPPPSSTAHFSPFCSRCHPHNSRQKLSFVVHHTPLIVHHTPLVTVAILPTLPFQRCRPNTQQQSAHRSTDPSSPTPPTGFSSPSLLFGRAHGFSCRRSFPATDLPSPFRSAATNVVAFSLIRPRSKLSASVQWPLYPSSPLQFPVCLHAVASRLSPFIAAACSSQIHATDVVASCGLHSLAQISLSFVHTFFLSFTLISISDNSNSPAIAASSGRRCLISFPSRFFLFLPCFLFGFLSSDCDFCSTPSVSK